MIVRRSYGRERHARQQDAIGDSLPPMEERISSERSAGAPLLRFQRPLGRDEQRLAGIFCRCSIQTMDIRFTRRAVHAPGQLSPAAASEGRSPRTRQWPASRRCQTHRPDRSAR